MIKSVEFRGGLEAPTKINLITPDPTGLTIEEISGTGAPKAQLHATARALLDGDVFNGARVGPRNLLFDIGYGHRLDPEVGRDLSYGVFPIKQEIEMVFETGLRSVRISGYVESNDTEMFTKDPIQNISIMCIEQPYFQSLETERTKILLYRLDSKFEFPFSNESLTENLINLGEYNLDNVVEFRYPGSIPTGMTIRFLINGPVVNPSITSETTGQMIRLDTNAIYNDTGTALGAGDVVEICTVPGSKSVNVIRGARNVNIMNSFADVSEWILLQKGLNRFSINATSGVEQFQTEIEFDTLYTGI